MAGEDIPAVELPPECTTDTACAPPNDPCKAAACVDGACKPVALPEGTTCTTYLAAADKCVLQASCKGGVCLAQAGKPCADTNSCTVDMCNPASGNCVYEVLGNGAPCDEDGLECTLNSCFNGKCVAAVLAGCAIEGACGPAGHKPGNPCLLCVDGGKAWTPVGGTPCDDGDACTGGDTCAAGACKGGTPVACDDKNGCTVDGCAPETGCTHTPASGAPPCEDGSACTLGDHCEGALCVAGVAKACDDGNPCTDDGCDTATGACLHSNNAAPCDDGKACSLGDVCKGGVCVGDASGCQCVTDGDCPGGTTCEPKVCVDYKCVLQVVIDGAPCDDSDFCTLGDACKAGLCAGSGSPACDDGNACTDDACVPSLGCTHTPNALPCDDGNACTASDTCWGGACAGAATSCDDGNACTDDACDPAMGCTHDALSLTPCTPDTSECTADLCGAGVCVHPLAAGFDGCLIDGQCVAKGALKPGAPCWGCVPSTSPTSWSALSGTTCDDGDKCSTGDTCSGGVCSATGALACAPKACVTSACDSALGCVDTPVACLPLHQCDAGKNACLSVSQSGFGPVLVPGSGGLAAPTLGQTVAAGGGLARLWISAQRACLGGAGPGTDLPWFLLEPGASEPKSGAAPTSGPPGTQCAQRPSAAPTALGDLGLAWTEASIAGSGAACPGGTVFRMGRLAVGSAGPSFDDLGASGCIQLGTAPIAEHAFVTLPGSDGAPVPLLGHGGNTMSGSRPMRVWYGGVSALGDASQVVGWIASVPSNETAKLLDRHVRVLVPAGAVEAQFIGPAQVTDGFGAPGYEMQVGRITANGTSPQQGKASTFTKLSGLGLTGVRDVCAVDVAPMDNGWYVVAVSQVTRNLEGKYFNQIVAATWNGTLSLWYKVAIANHNQSACGGAAVESLRVAGVGGAKALVLFETVDGGGQTSFVYATSTASALGGFKDGFKLATEPAGAKHYGSPDPAGQGGLSPIVTNATQGTATFVYERKDGDLGLRTIKP